VKVSNPDLQLNCIASLWFSLVCASATNIVAVLFIVATNDFTSLAPFEVIRVEEGVNQDDNVHEWRCEKVHNVAYEVLRPLKVVSR
jgi:hypothetical protein